MRSARGSSCSSDGAHTGGHPHPAILAMSQLPWQPAVHTVRGGGGVQGRPRRVSQWPRHAAQFGRPRSAHVGGARFRQDGPMLGVLKGSARPRSPAVGLPGGTSSSSRPSSWQRRCPPLPTPILYRRRHRGTGSSRPRRVASLRHPGAALAGGRGHAHSGCGRRSCGFGRFHGQICLACPWSSDRCGSSSA